MNTWVSRSVTECQTSLRFAPAKDDAGGSDDRKLFFLNNL